MRSLFVRTGEANWGRIRTIVDPLVEKSLTSPLSETFARRSGITLAKGPSQWFPKEMFEPIYGMTYSFPSGRTVSIVADPTALRRLMHKPWGIATDLEGTRGLYYRGTIAHELLEASYAPTKMGKFHELLGHYHPDVLRGHGYFLQRIGMTKQQMAEVYGLFEMPGYRFMKEGWRMGRRMAIHPKLNKALMVIEAQDWGKWGREITTDAIDSDFIPGSSWQQSVRKVIEPFVKAITKKGMTFEKFAKMAQVELMSQATARFPAEKFRGFAGGGRTVLYKSGEGVAMVASPKELARRGTDILNQQFKQAWAGGVVHERLELEFLKRGKAVKQTVAELSHAHSLIPRGHGYFLQRIGVKESQLASFITKQDMPYVLEGFKLAEQNVLKSRNIISMIDESLIELKGAEILRGRNLQRAAYKSQAAGIGLEMNFKRIQSKNMGY